MTLKNKSIYTGIICTILIIGYILSLPSSIDVAKKELERNTKEIQSIELQKKELENKRTKLETQINELELQKSNIEIESNSYKTILDLHIIPKADAWFFSDDLQDDYNNDLEFGRSINIPDVDKLSFIDHSTGFSIFQWHNAPEWKNNFLKRVQIRFYSEGYAPEQVKLIVAMTIQESGVNLRAHNPVNEDSFGLWQLNRRWLKKPVDFLHPNDDIAFQTQLDWFVNRINYYNNQGRPSFECVVKAHNTPYSDSSWEHNKCVSSKYFKDVARHLNSLYII